MNLDFEVILGVVIAIVLAVAIGVSIKNENEFDRKCSDSDGISIISQDGEMICIRKDAILK